ncbi:hypothetical protein [Curtobacterium sp. MCSS17_007]|uniref:hypothetical protein n=1 Tax=Curtobacterium sp. MCSS17_007 TaxID=2175646 RepID=UPI000DA9990B|nr:hypothetical protein [Curtobacterium sp. MCSS17_007]WIE75847.1 hypothetical protein DEJ22_000875 [Curtobacterium sp. MCSS17_007]
MHDTTNQQSGSLPWAHVLGATAIGLGAAQLARAATLLTLFTGVPGLVALLGLALVTCAALGGLAALTTRRRRAAWLGVTALVLVPAVFVVELLPAALAGPGPTIPLLAFAPTPYLVGAVGAAVPAMLVHRGVVRRLGIAASTAAAVAIVALVVTVGVRLHEGDAQRDQQAIARAQDAVGADFRPVTISPDGYGSVYEANIEKRLPGFLQVFSSPAEKAHAPGDTSGSDLTVVTLAAATAPCGRPIEGVAPGGGPEPETSCDEDDGVVRRTSEHGHEVAAVVGDTLVAVSALPGVDDSVLEAAVRYARPIDDEAYRHVLLGDGGEYTDELDGNRCPVVGAARAPAARR